MCVRVCERERIRYHTNREVLVIDVRVFKRVHKSRMQAFLRPQTFFEHVSNHIRASPVSHGTPGTFLKGRNC